MPRSQDFVEKAKLANAAAIYLTFAEYIKMEGRAFPGTSPSLYDKDFPFFRQPTILGSFSVDGKTPFVFTAASPEPFNNIGVTGHGFLF